MASTVLPNGIIIPEKYSRDWYNDLYHNWQELDNLLGGGTPKDGTLTIQKNGTTVGTFSANQATDETIDITVPDVNNGTLTIQQNGTTVDTFTANSSSDKTVNIQCVDLTNNQTVGGIKTFSNAPVVNSISLDGKTIDTDVNDNMTFNGHIVDTIEEQGDEYIRYSNGLQICWGSVPVAIGTSFGYDQSSVMYYSRDHTFNYPKGFSSIPVVSLCVFTSNIHPFLQVCVESSADNIDKKLTTGSIMLSCKCAVTIQHETSIHIQAIGRWK